MRDEIMKRSVKIIAGSAAVIVIVVAVVYAALPRPAQEPIFELVEWRLSLQHRQGEIVPKGSVMIEFTCVTNEFVEIVLLGPTGEMVGRTYLPTDATEGAVAMARWEVPMAGTYEMVVGYPRHPFEGIVEYTFTFSPPHVQLEEISLDWEFDEVRGDFVSEIKVEFMNRGDLPARISLFPDRPIFWPAEGWLVPRERVLVFDLWDPPPKPPGPVEIPLTLWLTTEDTLIVMVEGSEGEVLFEHRIPLSHKPDYVYFPELLL